MDVKTLTARRMAGGVHEIDRERTDLDRVAPAMRNEMGGSDTRRTGDPWNLVFVDVHGNVAIIQQLGDSCDGVAHHVATYVVCVIVAHKDTLHAHPVGAGKVQDFLRRVSRVDDEALLGLNVPDQIDVVRHLRRETVVLCEVATRQELSEIDGA